MHKILDRELYLWQATLIFIMFLSCICFLGYQLNKIYFAQEYDPLSKTDRQMVILQNKKNKTAFDFNQLGLVYVQKGAVTESKQAFIKAIALNNEYVDAYYNLGLVYFSEKDFSKAEKYFNETLKRDSTRDVVRFNLAKIHIEKGQFGDAEQSLKQARGSYITDADYYYLLAMVYKNTGKRNDAIANLETALKFDPVYREAARELTEILKVKN